MVMFRFLLPNQLFLEENHDKQQTEINISKKKTKSIDLKLQRSLIFFLVYSIDFIQHRSFFFNSVCFV